MFQKNKSTNYTKEASHEKGFYQKFVGLDVYSKTISVAIADEGPKEEVRNYGTIENKFEAIDKVIKLLTETGVELRFITKQIPAVLLYPIEKTSY